MPFEIVTTTTVVNNGPPDDSTFEIHLEDGTVLIGTGAWPHYRNNGLALHLDFLPDDVRQLVDGVYERRLAQEVAYLKDAGKCQEDSEVLARDRVKRDSIVAVIQGGIKVGAPVTVSVCIPSADRTYGQKTFGSVARLEVST